MQAIGRRRFLFLAAAFGLVGRAGAADEPQTLHLAPAIASILAARAVESGTLPEVRVAVWRTPDVLRAGIVSGSIRVFTAPTTVPANLYNRGAPLRLLSVTGLGNMSIVAADPAIRSLADLEGRTVHLFFKNDMPDLVFRYLMGRLGLEAGRHYRIEYVGSATEAMQLMLAGRAESAVLAEPNTSMTLARGPFRRAVDIQQAWSEITGGPPRIPVSGIAATEEFARDHRELLRTLHAATAEALAWTRGHPAEAAAMAERLLGTQAEAVEACLAHANMAAIGARAARPDLERLWNALAEISPAVIGGRLPDDGFYLDV